MNTVLCSECKYDFLFSLRECPHCGRPSRFPNVDAALVPEEVDALTLRYDQVYADAKKAGSEAALASFETACAQSRAVIARSINEVTRLSSSPNEVYATFYQHRRAGIRIPKGSKWDVLREVTDGSVFPGYAEHIRFGALSLEERGLDNYGECNLPLKEEMIAHRATVYEENTVLFMLRQNISLAQTPDLPKGFRATWEDRGRLCVAKIGEKVKKETEPKDFPALLLRQGVDSGDDEFVEAHIFGPMTIHTFEKVCVDPNHPNLSTVDIQALRELIPHLEVI